MVGGGFQQMDPVRVEAIKCIPKPKTMKEVSTFLGTAEWYHRFIPRMKETKDLQEDKGARLSHASGNR